MLPTQLKNFAVLFHNASQKGVLLIIACFSALIFANSSLEFFYTDLIHTKLFSTNITLEKIVVDGMMVLFFLLVGLEVKRELSEGNLSSKASRMLPIIAAIGGVVGPIFIYLLMNYSDDDAIYGWAVPAATDIAFALAVFGIFAKGLPISLRVFLTALAVIDDIIAVLMIAVFYTSEISYLYLLLAVIVMIMLFFCSKYLHNDKSYLYGILGLALWFCVLNSGIHATIAGVLLGFLIPNKKDGHSLLKKWERYLHPWVMFLILPLFAFVSSGVSMKYELSLSHTVTLGIILGLFIGKPLGILSAISLCRFFNVLPKKHDDFTPQQFFSVSILCGIGFTMSLFIGKLAFINRPDLLDEMKVGVLAGSLLSAIVGGIIIKAIKK